MRQFKVRDSQKEMDGSKFVDRKWRASKTRHCEAVPTLIQDNLGCYSCFLIYLFVFIAQTLGFFSKRVTTGP